MRRLRNTFLKGFAVVLPVTLTLYLVYWLSVKAEALLGDGLRALFPRHYWPGMGLITGFVLVLLVGIAVNAYIVRRILRFGEDLLARIPLVKTIYGAAKDITRFLPTSGERRDLKRVVLWQFGSAQLVGFVTNEAVSSRVLGEHAADCVAVYFPMSYQIGGHTLYLPKSELRPIDLSVEEAMRMTLIGGMAAQDANVSRATA